MIQGGESKCYDLIIYDDALPEAYERVILVLDSSNNAAGNILTTRVIIVDDDGISMHIQNIDTCMS